MKDFPNAWTPGRVIEVRGPLSYLIEIEDGRVIRRHVDALRSQSSATENIENSGQSAEQPDTEIPSPPFDSTTDSAALNANEAAPPEVPATDELSSREVTLPLRSSSRRRPPPDRFGFSSTQQQT